MREIKFRAWDKYHQEWINLYQIVFNMDGSLMGVWDLESNLYGLHQVDLLQYTGLKDKNGKEIYEGDIVHAGVWGTAGYWNTDNFIIAFEKGTFRGYRQEYYKTDREWSMSTPLYKLGDVTARKVIGNIYENKELLK